MRIVFMGTPDYSVSTLNSLINSKHEVVGVFSQPDKPVGRKRIISPTPTKAKAIEYNIPVFQPQTLRDGEALNILKELNPDIIVVVAYGKILPKEILYFPKYGSINGHASILPKLRGASPIQWAIVTGESKTGVTVMQMDEGMDTGDILDVAVTSIGENETAEELFDRLCDITADIIMKVLDDIENGNVNPINQDESKATYAPIIKKEMALLDFNEDAITLSNKVRGFYSWPCAYFMLEGKRIKVISAKAQKSNCDENGIVVENKGRLIISCGNNTALELIKVQPEGSKEMLVSQMLNGKNIEIGTKVNE